MKSLLLGLCLLLLLPTFSVGDEIDSQALAAAFSFASLIDEQNLPAAYWMGSPLLQRANAEQEWIARAERSQRVLGKVMTRKLNRLRTKTRIAYLPDDDYRVIIFEVKTEHKAIADETMLVHQVNGLWQVCSYSIH